MPNSVEHWEIAAKNDKKQQEFYAKLFDWKINADNPMKYGLVQTGGPPGIDGGIYAAKDGKPAVTIYVSVDDLQAYLKKAERLGGKAVVQPTPIPGHGSFAMFLDPEGNCIGLFKGQ